MIPIDAQRYIRQTILPEIGHQGQEKLAGSSVLIAGAGGLGSASALYLAAAGVGHILVADNDCVEPSNLNRQIIHTEVSLGRSKVASAAKRIHALNSDVRVTQVFDRITHATIDAMLNKVDIIVDGCDNFETRQVLNRASLRHGLPFVFGGVQGFDGMVSTFIPGRTPCFECIIPGLKTPPDQNPGVIGPAAGVIASIQAMETIKLLLGIGKSLENRLFRITGLDLRVHFLTLSPNPDCTVCGHIPGG